MDRSINNRNQIKRNRYPQVIDQLIKVHLESVKCRGFKNRAEIP